MSVRAQRVPRAAVRLVGRVLNPLLHRFECSVLGAGRGPLRFPPVFIVGPPRCGSTLLYQLMLDYLDFAYISNLHCKVYGAPSIVEALLRPSRWREPFHYSSDHGRVRGLAAPSECGDYWYRFFRRKPQYVPLSEVSERALRELRRSVRALSRAAGRPLLFKNLVNSVRIQPILRALPEAKFIVVRRDVLETAHSILEARRNLYGDYNRWFSVEPPSVEEIRERPPQEQAVEQVRAIYALIERDRLLAPTSFADVDYVDLCQHTREVLDSVGEFLSSSGVHVRRLRDVPPSFPMRRGVRIDEELYGRLRDYVRRTG